MLLELAAIPAVRTAVMAQARDMQLTLNARTGDLADPRVRRAVLALLDPALLAAPPPKYSPKAGSTS